MSKLHTLKRLKTLTTTKAKTCKIMMLPISDLRYINFKKSKNTKHKQLFTTKKTFT